jgi:hypothetical protein
VSYWKQAAQPLIGLCSTSLRWVSSYWTVTCRDEAWSSFGLKLSLGGTHQRGHCFAKAGCWATVAGMDARTGLLQEE